MTYFSISSQELTKEAKKMWFDVEILIPEKNFFIIRWNWKEILFKSTDFGWNTSLAYKIASDKVLTYTILEKYWYPIPKTQIVKKNENYKLKDFEFPVIIKPTNESHWNWVKMNIQNEKQLKQELQESFEKYNSIIIQEQVEGNETRVLVVKGKIILAINRIPPFIIGDWKHSIEELIQIENNTNPLRWNWYEKPLSYIKVDSETTKVLSTYWYKLDSIPRKWEKVFVRLNSNLWTWWTIKDVTNILHPEIKKLCLEITDRLWFGLCWLDLIIKDYTKPVKKNAIILELNATPSIGWHKQLTNVNTAKEILKLLFSE